MATLPHLFYMQDPAAIIVIFIYHLLHVYIRLIEKLESWNGLGKWFELMQKVL